MTKRRQFSGPQIVAGMFLFALVVSAGLWGYWELHTRPYRALTDALGERFPHSNPRVEGGKHGMHQETPRVLRIVLRVDYHPQKDDAAFQAQQREILQTAQQLGFLEDIDVCEIHLFQQLPEQEPVVRSETIPRVDFPGER